MSGDEVARRVQLVRLQQIGHLPGEEFVGDGQRLVGEGINHAGIKRIIELETAMANMAVEVAKLRTEVDALLLENPPKSLVKRGRDTVVLYKGKKK